MMFTKEQAVRIEKCILYISLFLKIEREKPYLNSTVRSLPTWASSWHEVLRFANEKEKWKATS